MASPPRQNVLDPLPLVIPQPLTTHRSASQKNELTAYESLMILIGNPLIEDGP